VSAEKATVLDDLVRNQVEKRPEKTAILFQEQSISYEAFFLQHSYYPDSNYHFFYRYLYRQFINNIY